MSEHAGVLRGREEVGTESKIEEPALSAVAT